MSIIKMTSRWFGNKKVDVEDFNENLQLFISTHCLAKPFAKLLCFLYRFRISYISIIICVGITKFDDSS